MDFNGIVTLVQNLGFPIAVCIAMFWMNVRNMDMHKEEMQKVTDALNNNTLVVQKLSDKIDNIDRRES